jgi:hypothetical protein
MKVNNNQNCQAIRLQVLLLECGAKTEKKGSTGSEFLPSWRLDCSLKIELLYCVIL